MASGTLYDALERLSRYIGVLSNIATHTRVQRSDDTVALVESYSNKALMMHRAANDAGYVALIKLCQALCRRPIHPVSAELVIAKDDSSDAIDGLFGCPIVYGADEERIFFAREDADQPLPGWIPEILDTADEVSDRYLESLDSSSVSAEVRKQIMQLLPSGHADQSTVADTLYRSRSTLQRQLSAEGTSFRDILDTTRRSLAERYLRAGELSQAEIAFLTGFADQSNFSRAFKRWVGVTPGDFQKVPQQSDAADAR
jgi:AraC-like DNA-binding protein